MLNLKLKGLKKTYLSNFDIEEREWMNALKMSARVNSGKLVSCILSDCAYIS